MKALEQPTDEVLVVSHSMGASLALAVIGRALELKPDALDGRKLSFATLGGAALQCAFPVQRHAAAGERGRNCASP